MHVRSRRDFLKKSALLSAALAAIPSTPKVHASENNELKIGLVGCGGRGCGAAGNALDADPNVKLICAADVFPTRGKSAIEGLREKYGDRVDVPEDRFFDGFDGYKKVLEQDIDIALLVTPQHFRPTMIKAAIDAGKHVFAEKPVAVDGVGIKMIQEAGELAKQKGLNIVGGLVNRYGASAKEVISRIADGAIGEVVTARGDRMGGSLWMRPRTEGQTEMEYQMTNWVNFNWMASEYINDVTIHQLDIALWSFNDATPVGAYGMGGRLTRRGEDTGDMYDSMAVVYEFADGRSLYAFSRQIPGSFSRALTTINGSKGYAVIGNLESKASLFIGGEEIKIPRGETSGYVVEHKVLIDAVRSGGDKYVNNVGYMTNSTGCAILGRMCSFNGQYVTWEEMLESEGDKPSEYSMTATPPTLPDEKGRYKIALPCAEPGYLD
ncbi:MAG: Gfo/Idh/MocA family oxidoreductase [Thermoguttaceae bacterium]|nr:Gfo/Idh/MocA family oxidoreductase [Thermoguttaceae bacterium]